MSIVSQCKDNIPGKMDIEAIALYLANLDGAEVYRIVSAFNIVREPLHELFLLALANSSSGPIIAQKVLPFVYPDDSDVRKT